jgi:alpha-1,6-mannosyltransferase
VAPRPAGSGLDNRPPTGRKRTHSDRNRPIGGRGRAWLGAAGLAGLALAAVPLAAPGPELVPAAQGNGPGWLLGLYADGLGIGPGAYYAFLWCAFAAYLCVLLAAPALDGRLLRGASVLLIFAFALAPPLLSQDVFSYIDYARLGVLGDLNPYSHDPTALPEDSAFPFIGWADSPSAYGPLFTLLTYPLASLSLPAALWTLKGLAAASVLTLALLVARIAPSRGVDPRSAFVMVALNPLVLVHVVGGAHNDATTMLVAFAGCAAVLAAHELSAGFALASAIALKASAAFAAPFALLATRPTGRNVNPGLTFRPVGKFLVGGAVALMAIALAAYAAYGWEWFDGLGVVGENQGRVSNYSLPNLLSELLNLDVDIVRVLAAVAYLAVLAALLRWVHRGGDWTRATGWAALGLLLATAWLLPWYIIWALPFAAISRDDRLIAAVLALTALQLAARVPL